MIASTRLPLRNDPTNNQFERPSADLLFDPIVVHRYSAVLEVSSQCSPALKAVIKSFGYIGQRYV